MARRNRRRTRPRHNQHRHEGSVDSTRKPLGQKFHANNHSAPNRQMQWNSWQMRRAEPSPEADTDILSHRLRLFGGDENDGTVLCAPMLQVVMDLFDGGLDYMDP